MVFSTDKFITTIRKQLDGIADDYINDMIHDAKIIANINESIKKQSEMSIEMIADSPKKLRPKKATKKAKGKTKRVKITKRTKRDQR